MPINAAMDETNVRRGGGAPRKRYPKTRAIAWAVVVVLGLFGLLPIYWMIVTALTPNGEVFTFPPHFIPQTITFEHFAAVAGDTILWRYLGNSVLISLVTALLTLIVATYTAYSFSKFRYRGRKAMMFLVLSSQMFPHALLLITLYLIYAAVGLLNTYLGVVMSFTAFTLPLCIWMLKGIFDTLPNEILEAATMDGANQFVIIHRILLPISAPGLVAAGLFAFMRGWNDFIFALTLAGPETMTLQPGLVNHFVGEFGSQWPELMAASIAVSLPVIIGFIWLQRYLVGGLAGGAVKG